MTMSKRMMIILGLLCFVMSILSMMLFHENIWQLLISFLFMNASWSLIIYSDPDNRKKMGWKNR